MHRVVSRPKNVLIFWYLKHAALLRTGSNSFAARRTRSFAFPGPNRASVRDSRGGWRRRSGSDLVTRAIARRWDPGRDVERLGQRLPRGLSRGLGARGYLAIFSRYRRRSVLKSPPVASVPTPSSGGSLRRIRTRRLASWRRRRWRWAAPGRRGRCAWDDRYRPILRCRFRQSIRPRRSPRLRSSFDGRVGIRC